MKKLLIGTAAIALLAPALAHAEPGEWRVRGRLIGVVPQEDSKVSAGGKAEVGDAIVPELDFTYFLTNNIAAELILGTTKHDVDWTVGPTSLGSVWLLPPTLTLQYHFLPDQKFQPYVGAGVNYTIFYNVDEPAGLKIDYDNSFGLALQAGADVMLNDNWFINADVKKLFLSTDVSINNGAIRADVDLDPWIFGIGIGRKF